MIYDCRIHLRDTMCRENMNKLLIQDWIVGPKSMVALVSLVVCVVLCLHVPGGCSGKQVGSGGIPNSQCFQSCCIWVSGSFLSICQVAEGQITKQKQSLEVANAELRVAIRLPLMGCGRCWGAIFWKGGLLQYWSDGVAAECPLKPI